MLRSGRTQSPAALYAESNKLPSRGVLADWSAYATAYDLLADHNPAYQALLRDFEAFISTIEPPRLVYDVGGGTGNYTEILARAFPDSAIYFIEPDEGMGALAKAKLAARDNVTCATVTLEDFDAGGEADLVICVHALYAMPAQQQRITDLHGLLRPGGLLYLVDLGRYMNVADWRGYLFSHLKKEHGFFGALRIFWQGREIARQNSAIQKAQEKGTYWTHSEEEIASHITAAGFEILTQQTAYRGYSDRLVCRATS